MRLFGNVKSGQTKQQAGFTLIEVIVAVVLMSVAGIVIIRAIDTNTRSNIVIDEQVMAVNLATRYLEAIRSEDYDTSDPPYPDVKVNIPPPPTYDVNINAEYSNDGETWVSTYSDQKLQKVTVTVLQTNGKVVRSFCSFKVYFPGE